jgi:uncharacterized alkaline shock family protein YloU
VKEETRNEAVEVSRDAVAALVIQAVDGVDGAVLSQQKPVVSIASLVKRGSQQKKVKVSREEESFNVSVYLKVDYGKNMPSLAQELAGKIKEYVEGLTDVHIAEVEIVVEDIEPPA